MFGPLLVIFGVGLLFSEKAQMVHRVANGGQIFGSGFDVVMWSGFALVGLLFALWGLWMLQSDRRSWISNHELWTVRGLVPMGHRRYKQSDIQSFAVSEEPVTVVFGNRSTTMGSRYQVAVWFKTKKLKPKKMIITNCSNEAEALKIKTLLEQEVGVV
ncbi:TPA: hypothetical protein DEP96_04340 [Candidatus Uhrbacteria bacterium]|nr:hypothetical protein [Candidatus Uhrbacteria bacterium]